MPKTLNDFLTANHVDLEETLVVRHCHKKFENLLPRLAFSKHDEFNAYQSCYNSNNEASLKKCAYLVSFVVVPGKGNFLVGIYENRENWVITKEEFQLKSELQRFIKFGYGDEFKWDEEKLWFDLHRTKIMEEYIGRLSLGWDGGRNIVRKPAENNLPIKRILQNPVLVSGRRI